MGRTIDIMISICSHFSTMTKLVCDICCIAILLSNDKKYTIFHDLILVVQINIL